jgi:exonuclease III
MDPEKILVWNVRGLNSSARQAVVRTMVESSRADIVCLQETKMEAVSQRILLSMLGSDFSHILELPAVGASGGALIAWRQGLGSARDHRIDSHSVSVQFCPVEGQSWWLTCVYGPQGNEEKIQFMQKLQEIRAACHGPWMLAGDFNLIYRAKDKNNDNYNRVMMGWFRRLIDDLSQRDATSRKKIYLVKSTT